MVRSGEQLERIGKMAELFDDFSPLQLFATGKYENRAFTIVGRLQYAWADGRWSEWHCAFDGESQYENQAGTSTGWLSEDNGQYVFMREVQPERVGSLPPATAFRLGAQTAVGGKTYSVTAARPVHLASAQGELPKLPPLNHSFDIVELRAEDGAILSIEYHATDAPPRVYVGVGVQLPGLAMSGLKDESTKEEKTARQFGCPHCGAPVALKLEASKTITCGSCSSVIDTSQGPGQEVVAALQTEPVKPMIALGKAGTLQGVDWQVVGFVHRSGQEPGDDETFAWDEYLLYNRIDGFAFLVDSSEGWSLARPTVGAPKWKAGNGSASYMSKSYALQYQYNAETQYVLGEFYWKVARGQQTVNHDFASGHSKLAREQSGDEVTWSRGDPLAASLVAQAFGVSDVESVVRDDVQPFASSGMGSAAVTTLVVMVVLVVLMMSMCSSRCDPKVENCATSSGSRSGGGSYGGWSGGGGGHK